MKLKSIAFRLVMIVVTLIIGFILGIMVTTRSPDYRDISSQPTPTKLINELQRVTPWITTSRVIKTPYFYEITSSQTNEINVIIAPNRKRKSPDANMFPTLLYKASTNSVYERWDITDKADNVITILSENGKFQNTTMPVLKTVTPSEPSKKR